MLHIYYNIKRILSFYIFICFYYFRIIILLKRDGFLDVKPFKTDKWHHGFAYFMAQYENSKVFIKTDTKFNAIKNDVEVYGILKEVIGENILPVLKYSLNHTIKYVVYDFLENAKELDENAILKKSAYIGEIIDIIDKINIAGIIHRDIKLDNFLLCNNKIKIIDFTFCCINNADILNTKIARDCRILSSLGTGFKPSEFSWDDFYSLYKILFRINAKNSNIFDNYIKLICSRIGKATYSTSPKSYSFLIIKQIKKICRKVLRV